MTPLSAWLERDRLGLLSRRLGPPGGAEDRAGGVGNAAVEPETVANAGRHPLGRRQPDKPLCCGELARIASDGGLDLDRPPGAFFPAWKRPATTGSRSALSKLTRPGCQPGTPLCPRRGAAVREPSGDPARRRSASSYSDLNLILFGDVLEPTLRRRSTARSPISSRRRPADRRRGSCLRMPGPRRRPRGDETERRMTAELGLSYRGSGPASCGVGSRRQREPPRGVAGNTGLFGTARDVWALARGWLANYREDFCGDSTPLLSRAAASLCSARVERIGSPGNGGALLRPHGFHRDLALDRSDAFGSPSSDQPDSSAVRARSSTGPASLPSLAWSGRS